ncbi:PREDICTED: uncharacterized protein LOC106743421 [Dinoponera quadriceps]|uniref:Uncharacterized protein LOC106743421 n=1 Tax=Dinoponera quadriceps TaxID=609295 RepID=A0A6P3X378_DINQU|nr:PREDICTED: uncharacterized protein LOC106743421 [Dinoponera quadriceps]
MCFDYVINVMEARRFANKYKPFPSTDVKKLAKRLDMNSLQKSRRKDEPLSGLVVLISLIIINAGTCGAESSGEYLQKVMIELQELNVPSNVVTHDRLSMNPDFNHADYQDSRTQYNSYRKLSAHNNAHQELQPNAHQNVQKSAANLPAEDMAQLASNNILQYYAVRDSDATAANYPKVKQPEQPLAYTRMDLAALYKKALERGSAISLSALAQTLNAAGGGNVPQVSTQLRLPLKYPMYNYYFFPLKSFASELQRDHHQTSAIGPIYAATENMENTENGSQKQLVNPLFVAIGTFISMALLFMMGVLFLPKLPHFQLFNARVVDDDFQRLTAFVTNAMDSDMLKKFPRS